MSRFIQVLAPFFSSLRSSRNYPVFKGKYKCFNSRSIFGDTILRKIADTSGLKVLNGEMYFPDDLSEIRDLSEKKLLPHEQQKALNEFIDLVRKLEDVSLGLPLSYRDFWGDFASHEMRVNEKTLKQIEGYLRTLGVSYAKDEKSIILDKYHHEAYSCGSSSWLIFTLTKEPQNQKS